MSEELESSNSTVASLDDIAELLVEDNEEVENEITEEVTEDLEEDESLADESTDDVNESDDVEEDSEQTWETVLNVDEGQLDYDDEGNIAGINVKVNDKSETVGMKDLIAGYQSNKSNTQKSQANAEARKVIESETKQMQADYTSKLDNVEQLTNYLGNKLVQDFDGINWEQLRVENPAEYAAMKQDYSQRASELKTAQDAIAQEKQIGLQQQQQQRQQAQQVYLKAQQEQMLISNPTWNNEETYKTDMGNIKSFAGSQYGFKDDDFNNVSDARIIEVLKDAMAYRNGVKTATNKRKNHVPKFQKSKQTGSKKASKLDKLTKKARSSSGAGKRGAQTDAIAELLLSG